MSLGAMKNQMSRGLSIALCALTGAIFATAERSSFIAALLMRSTCELYKSSRSGLCSESTRHGLSLVVSIIKLPGSLTLLPSSTKRPQHIASVRWSG